MHHIMVECHTYGRMTNNLKKLLVATSILQLMCKLSELGHEVIGCQKEISYILD